MMRRSNSFLSDDFELGKLQQQLFGACVLKLYCSFGVLPSSINPGYGSDAKTLMLDLDTFL